MSNPTRYTDPNGEVVHWVAGAIVGAVASGALNYISQRATLSPGDSVDGGTVLINAVGGAVGGALSAVGFGIIAAALVSGSTTAVEEAHINKWDYSKVNITEVLTSAALGAIGDRLVTVTSNTTNRVNVAHLNSMSNGVINRFMQSIGSEVSTGAELWNALKCFTKQTNADLKKLSCAILKSSVPAAADVSYGIYSKKVGA